MRGALAGVDGVERLDVRLPARELSVWHRGDVDEVRAALEALRLGVSLSHSDAADAEAMPEERNQRSVLQFLLAVNAIMFAVELVAGWHGESTGLLSDALDMLADAMVYGVALWAVGQDDVRQKVAARVSGYLQLGLGLGVLLEVVRRAWIGSTPEPPVMMVMALVALAANLACVIALARHRGDGVHMRASWIFSTNDVIANLGVLFAGALVHWTRAAWPDFVVGTIIGLVVIRGATRILRLGRE